MSSNSGYRNISRFHYGKCRAWFVHIGGPHPFRKLFSYSKHGGIRKALQAAVQARDAHRKLYPEVQRRPPLPGAGTAVRIMRKMVDRQGRASVYPVWAGYIRVKPKVSSHCNALTSWSIERWGDKEALQKVLAWLKEKRAIQVANYARVGVVLPKQEPVIHTRTLPERPHKKRA